MVVSVDKVAWHIRDGIEMGPCRAQDKAPIITNKGAGYSGSPRDRLGHDRPAIVVGLRRFIDRERSDPANTLGRSICIHENRKRSAFPFQSGSPDLDQAAVNRLKQAHPAC